MLLLRKNSFIHSIFKSLGEFDNHELLVIRRLFFAYTYTHTHSLLIEMSLNVARTHLTGAHQMHVIHPNSESDYTSRYILSRFSRRSTLFFRATRTQTLHSYVSIIDCQTGEMKFLEDKIRRIYVVRA